jgi:hypothetical protein
MLESSKQVISHRLIDIYNIITCDIPTINIPILSVSITNPVARGVFKAYYYALFCIGPGDANPGKFTLAAAMLGLLFNTIDPTRIIEGNNELLGHCINTGYRPNFIMMCTDQETTEIADREFKFSCKIW